MALQLPAQPAPPSSWATSDGARHAESKPDKKKRAPLLKNGSSIPSAKQSVSQSVPSSRSPVLMKRLPKVANGISNPVVTDIAEIRDIRRLEDMIDHSQTLLDNPALCSQLSGGREQVLARHFALEARLEHLYSIRTQENDDNEARYAAQLSRIHKESPHASLKLSSSPQSHTVESLAGIDDLMRQSTLASSPPSNGFHRGWSKALSSSTRMHGKTNLLSLEESLALQARESQRILSQQTLASGREGIMHEVQAGMSADAYRNPSNNGSSAEHDEQEEDDWPLPDEFDQDES